MKLSAFFAAVVLSQCPLGCSVYSQDLLDPKPIATPVDGPGTGNSMGGSSGAGNPPVKLPTDGGVEPGAPPDAGMGGTGGTGGAPSSDNDSGAPSEVDGGGGANPAPADAGDAVGGSGGAQPPPNPALVDDFEDRNISLLPRGKRSGYWFADGQEDDGTITALAITALMPPREESEYGIHVVASGYTADPTWAVLGANFNFDDSNKKPLAYAGAADYAGIRFWAKHGGSSESDTVRIELPTTDTSSAHDGDDDNHGVLIMLNPEWTLHTILWGKFEQAGWGTYQDFIPAHVTTIQFKLNSPADTGFDLWLDDIEFVK